MRKMLRTLVFGVVIAAPLLLVPHQSKANGFLDGLENIIKSIFDGDRKKHTSGAPGTTTSGNSVPLNEGQVFLIIAGLGLGAKMIYDNRKKLKTASI